MVRARTLSVLAGLLALLLAAAAPASGNNGAERVDVIVVFHDDVQSPGSAANDVARRHNGDVRGVYQHALKGFAGTFPEGALQGIERDRRVDYVELDGEVYAFEQTVPTGIDRTFATANSSAIGIDGVDDRVDADIAIVDSGIDSTHEDLNVVAHVDCTSGTCVNGGTDGNGHGTHVAGTAAALDNGVGVVGMAPGARLHGARVLDSTGSGLWSWVAAGIDWSVGQGVDVINLSLGCYDPNGDCSSQAIADMIAKAETAGIVAAVAAGNDSADAKDAFPANLDNSNVLTVSALDDRDGTEAGRCVRLVGGGPPRDTCYQYDDLASFSNFGADIELAAPGYAILSTVPGGYGTKSGTSMATPHVAGAAAVLASKGMSLADIRSTLLGKGNFNWNDDSGDGIHEPLLDVSDGTVFDPVLVGVDAPPVADFTASCTDADLTCTFTDASTDDGTITSWSWDFGDGGSSTTQNPSHTYASAGVYTVTLTVTDDNGSSSSASKTVDVGDTPPSASFTYRCTDLGCQFTDTSTDDGTISSWAWSFGDGSGSGVQNPSHTYGAGGDYTVSLTVTDDGGQSDTVSQTVSVSEPASISLTANGHKVKGRHHIDLTWSGATSTNVDVVVNGSVVATTANDGAYTYSTDNVGGATYTVQVCEAGTSTCSAERTVVF